MKGKKLIGVLVLVLSILIFELLSSTLSGYILSMKGFTSSPYKATLIGMGVVLFVLFPAYKWMDGLVQKLAIRFLKAGKNITGTYVGMACAFLLIFFTIYLLYLRMWFDISAGTAIKKTVLTLLQLF